MQIKRGAVFGRWRCRLQSTGIRPIVVARRGSPHRAAHSPDTCRFGGAAEAHSIIGAGEHNRWNVNANRLRSLEVQNVEGAKERVLIKRWRNVRTWG
jgi:hypothetical protein